LGFPSSSASRESAGNEGDLGSIPGLRRSPGEGNGYPLQYSGLENSMENFHHPGKWKKERGRVKSLGGEAIVTGETE